MVGMWPVLRVSHALDGLQPESGRAHLVLERPRLLDADHH